MTMTAPLVYKRATEPWELEQIHRLNYETFVEEIPQHTPNERGALVDRFHDENAYFVCRHGEQVIGMIALRGTRPWSLDAKLADVDRYLPLPGRWCEIRLLAIDRRHRGGRVIEGLVAEVARYGVSKGYVGAVISGIVRQERLYRHLGFVPFGPRVGTEAAPYQPMYITLHALRAFRISAAPPEADDAPREHVSFQPGPVDVHADVLRVLGERPVSHRDPEFVEEVARLRQTLCALTNAHAVELLEGSGTLANDVVAGQLARIAGDGIVFANGEFGERLVDHARRAGLRFAVERHAWGAPVDRAAIDAAFARHPRAAWAWLVHLETSTGVRNELAYLAERARARDVRVAADCVSSVGILPLSLDGVHLASTVSGKGIGSVPGVAAVFHAGGLVPNDRLPRYLDLALYAAADSVPFTISSNLVRAMDVAARRTLLRGRFAQLDRLSRWLRTELRARSLALVAAEACAAPGIVTIALGALALAIGDALLARGFALSYRSAYLRERGWLQIALMGECTRDKLVRLLAAWDDVAQSAVESAANS